MFEQTSRLAEKLAASLSRRWFLGTLGNRGNRVNRGRGSER